MNIKAFKPIQKYLIKYKGYIIFGAISLVITDACGLMIPWLIKDAIDLIPSYKNIGKQEVLKQVLNYSIVIIIAAIFQAIFRYFWRTNLFYLGRMVEYHLRNDYFKKLLSLDYYFYLKYPTGELISRGTNDLNAIRELVGGGFLIFFDAIILMILSLGLMFYINPKLTIYCLIPMPLLTIIIYYIGDLIERTYEKLQQKLADLTTRVQENILGIRTIQAFCQEENEIQRFTKMANNYVKFNMIMVKVSSLEEPLVYFIFGISMSILLYFGGIDAINNKITIGELTALSGYLMMLTWPLFGLGWLINMYNRGIASLKRINEILEFSPKITYNFEQEINENLNNTNLQFNKLEFKNVSFSFPTSNKLILDNVSFKVSSGKILAITGPIGCGKTTICNLIIRFFDPTSGQILIDGVDIKDIPVIFLRKNIGYVRQDSFLFSNTVTSNIMLGNNLASFDMVKNVCEITNIIDDIENFPNKFDTLIGERGITVSGGQKQRLAIARTILKSPKILIFDDILSSVDNKTEKAILNKLLNYINKDIITIIVSHRISTIMHADEILVLDKGKIVESGNHQKLLENNGIYANLYHKQKLKFELEE